MRRSIHVLGFLLAASAAASIAAGADHEHGAPPSPSGTPPLFTGLGTHHFPVTTKSPKAQIYFDQGIRLVYAFNHDEAIRAFREAARLDPSCAMAHWGVAYALGPNINLPVDAEREKLAHEEVAKGLTLAPKATARERAYIAALSKRYTADPNPDYHALDVAYADAMRALTKKFPNDLDAATLFAEALLDVRPWDYWTLDGKPQPGTQEIVSTLEGVLKRSPNHIGAIHYYIHAVEASPHPERAVRYADRLARLAPSAGHLVHMPSHLYIQVGRYNEVSELNRKAIAADRAYIDQEKPQGVYPLMYYTHNIHMRWAGLTFQGRSADALRAARSVVGAVPPDAVRKMPPMEFWLPVPYYAMARFGKWEDILKEPAPPSDLRFTTGMWHYARGVARAATGEDGLAAVERDSVAVIAAATPADAMAGINASRPLLELAATVLSGEIALRRGSHEDAIRIFREAVAKQDSLRYDEPPPWYYPVRQSLGLALLKAGRAEEAERVYREDLKRYPGNGWSLYGLMESLNARGRVTEATQARARFKKAWARADVQLSGSVY